MALPLPPTLEDVRADVIIRSTIGSAGAISKTAMPLLNSSINRANQVIYQKAPWSRYTFTVDVATQNVSTDYDVPDDANGAGGLLRIDVLNLAGRPIPVMHNSDPHFYAVSEAYRTTPGAPSYWRYIDDVIRFDRFIDNSEWPTLRFTGQRAPQRMVDNADRAAVDFEALAQLATIYVKRALNLDFDDAAETRAFMDYLDDLRSNTAGPGEMFPIASQQLQGPAYWTAPSTDYSTPWAVDWNPVGWW